MRALACTLALLLAAPAVAEAHSIVRVEGGTLKYVATDTSDATAVNTVTVSQPSVEQIRIEDPTVFGGMDPGPCTPFSENRVDCSSAGITVTRVEAGLGNDPITIQSSLRSEVIAGEGADSVKGGPGPDFVVGGPGADSIDTGAGDDDIRVRDGEADTVVCGDGTDSVIADSLDDVKAGCEKVERGTPVAEAGAPVLHVGGLSVQRPLRKRLIRIVAVSDRPARIAASGAITAPGLKRIVLREVTAEVDVAGGGVELHLRLPARAVKALGKAHARLLVSATDADGGRTVKRMRITLER